MEISDEQVAVKEGFEDELFEIAGVTGVGIGMRGEDAERSGEEAAIRVYIEDAEEEPEGIPEELEGMPVSVIEFVPEPYGEDRTRYEPLKGGCRIEVPGRNPGTMGAIVQRRDIEGNPVLHGLTAGHVVGEPDEFPRIPFQAEAPSVFVGMDPSAIGRQDSLGRVVRSIFAESGSRTTIDAAIFELDMAELQGRGFSPAIVGVEPTEDLISGVTEIWLPEDRRPDPGQPVVKRGFVSRKTGGFVVDVHFSTRKWEPADSGLDKQFLVQGIPGASGAGLSFAQPGDSGSLVLEGEQLAAIGLLVGGDAGGTGIRGICTPIARIERALDFSTIWA
ncbi:MAG TPA: hypothetical protein VN522_12440 [Solirubrobacterales bacterium]|nr:hypothetical protein [Solirubrobacterales bacterium]